MDTLSVISVFGKSLLFAVATMLPIMNPLAIAPIFVDLTEGMNRRGRAALSMRIGRHVVILLVCSMLVGTYVLRFFGISLPVVRVGGGLVVAAMAWQLLSAQGTTNEDKEQIARTLTDEEARVRAFYPLTFPLTCGPGSISVAIALGASLHSDHIWKSAVGLGGGLLGMIVVGILVMLTYRYANTLLGRFGRTGHIVLVRLMAFLLLCIGIEIVWEGVRDLLLELPSLRG